MAWKTRDEKLGKYVEGYSGSGSSLNPTGSKVKVEADGTKSTPTKTTKTTKTSDINYTPYTKVTNKKVTQNTNPGGTGTDLSYVQSTDYYNSGVDWDYGADISKDKNRAKQMAYNLKADMKSNPKLFKSRSDYNKYYNYDKRSPSQKKMLDEFFDNANKYGLGATDNFYADMASSVADDKNKAKLSKAADTYNKMIPYLDDIRNKIDQRLGPVFDKLMDSQTKYLQDMAELRKLQRQYNKGMVEEANSRAAGQSASMGTMMSGQGLSQSAIASSMFGAEEAWVKELNKIQDQHINKMQQLSDAEADFTNNWAGIVGSLTSQEQGALKDWYNSFKTLQDNYDNVYNTMIDERYSPYETLTNAKVAGAAETLQSTGKADVKQSEYKGADKNKRQMILYNNLASVFGNYPDTLAKLSTYITSAAAEYNDFQTALTSILEKAGAKPQTIKNVLNNITEEPEVNDNNNEDPWENFDFSGINLGVGGNNSNNNINLGI